MADALRLITSPLPVAAGLGYADLSAALAADALARRSWAAGRPATLTLTALAGDLGGRLAFDRELVRMGHDRSVLPLEELNDAARAFDATRRRDASELLASLGVTPELDEGTVTPRAQAAAAVAFVRLHDQGLIDRSPAVVPYCPSCATVIEGPDAVVGQVSAEVLRVQLGDDPDLDVCITAPELLDGAVAVAVPVGHPAAGRSAILPLAARVLPVIAETGCTEPRLVVPAHDAGAYELAQLHGFVPVRVLGPDGVVVGDGPLGGLPRFAARQAARGLLEAEGVVVESTEGSELVERCRQCGSIAVPLLEEHWLLRVAELEVAAADAVRHDSVAFVPGDVRDVVLAAAGGPPWCLDRSVPGGVALPVATCTDCGRVTVGVDVPSACGKCFGELEPTTRTLDARFVAALSPLVRAGWPRRISPDHVGAAAATVAVVPPDAIATWALPALALGLHLAGYVPFGTVVVQPPQPPPPDLAVPEVDDVRVARLALLAATEVEAARLAVEGLDQPLDDADPAVMDAVEAAVAALDDGGPGRAAGLLVAALTGGVPAESADRVRALAVPLLGA